LTYNCIIIIIIIRLLNERYIQYTHLLEQLVDKQQQSSQQQHKQQQINNNIDKTLTMLHEDIHWLLLISGFVLCNVNADTNESLIPSQIMRYSIECSQYMQQQQADVMQLVTKLFATSSLNRAHANISNIRSATAEASSEGSLLTPNTISVPLIETRLSDEMPFDPITRLVFVSMQLGELESHMFLMRMLDRMSPQVASTLVWFMRELARSYLFMSERSYNELSPLLHTCFGQETTAGTYIFEYMIRKLYDNFYVWSAENKTTSQTAKLLLELVKRDEVCKLLGENKQFWSISKIAVANEMPWQLLPASVKKIIIKSLVVSCAVVSGPNATHLGVDSPLQAHFVNTILQPLGARFDSMNALKSENAHVESCIKEVMCLLETMNGILEGATRGLVRHLVPFVMPRLQQGIHLLDVYHNYGEIVELILSMFNSVIEKFLASLDDWLEAKLQIYNCFLCLIQVFSKHNSSENKKP
jgi:hypothetical protein